MTAKTTRAVKKMLRSEHLIGVPPVATMRMRLVRIYFPGG
jgi:hypothetical protein